MDVENLLHVVTTPVGQEEALVTLKLGASQMKRQGAGPFRNL